MTREEMIEKLRQSSFYANPTVQTMDMGLEYEAAFSDGAISGELGMMGGWPIFVFHMSPEAKVQSLKDLFCSDDESLKVEELKDTFLYDFACILGVSESDDIKKILKSFTNLEPYDAVDRIYCLCDSCMEDGLRQQG